MKEQNCTRRCGSVPFSLLPDEADRGRACLRSTRRAIARFPGRQIRDVAVIAVVEVHEHGLQPGQVVRGEGIESAHRHNLALLAHRQRRIAEGRQRRRQGEIIIDLGVEGFYAAGECACVSVHGANRLGANSVLEALLFGRHVGQSIANDLDGIALRYAKPSDAETMTEEMKRILASNGKETAPGLRNELQQSMTDNAGVFRTEATLSKQVEILKALRKRFSNIRIDDKSKIFNTDLQEAIELGHMLDYALFIVESALARKESRGAHYREDFTERDDANFMKHTMAYMDKDGNITLDYMAVTPGKFEPQERSY